MAVMRDIVTDILDELRFGSGQDVQIHLQTSIVKNVSRLYRTLMKKHVWRDYHFTNTYTTNSNGQVDAFATDTIDKFSNLLAVYLDNSDERLPVAPVISNVARFRRPVIVNSGGTSFFTIYPQQVRNITVISRMYSEQDFDMDQEVPFYKDVLALGAASMLSVKAGTNDDLTKMLQSQFNDLLSTYRMDELQDNYQTSIHRSGYPMEWHVNE